MAAAGGKKRSGIWKYFQINSIDESFVNCNTCSNKISRGGNNARSYGTTALVNHLRAKHPTLRVQYENECAQAAFETATRKRSYLESEGREGNLKQPSYSGFVDLKKSFEPSDPKQLKITRLIGEMIALDTQPFSIVEDAGFIQLTHFMEPRYRMPDRTHFSRRVIPDYIQNENFKV